MAGLYPSHYAPVAGLISRAELVAARTTTVQASAVEAFAASAGRVLAAAGAELCAHADRGFPGCLAISEVGRPSR